MSLPAVEHRRGGPAGLLRGPTFLLLCGVLVSLLPPAKAGAADIEAGRRKAQVCVQCHGLNGHSKTPTIPSLAGQQPFYTFLQLLQYREKRRLDAQMSPYAEKLSDADMEDLAAYYAAQRPFAARRPGDPAKIAAGRKVAETYHCASCHAPGLVGQKQMPRLVGQHYEYVLKQLRGFKAQTRSDIDGNMTTSAQPLSEQDIEDVAQYIASLPGRQGPGPIRRPGTGREGSSAGTRAGG